MMSGFQRGFGIFGMWRSGRDLKKVLVLGGSGMLGCALVEELSRQKSLQVSVTFRSSRAKDGLFLDASTTSPGDLGNLLQGQDFVLNAIGITKPYIRDDHAGEIARAVRVNISFPLALAEAAEKTGARVLQIATDCVFQGTSSQPYLETSPHDATDVYGKTKSLGEIPSAAMRHLRGSIIGREQGRKTFLVEWFCSQPKGAVLKGFEDHQWNGLTTRAFARICAGIIRENPQLPPVLHLVPQDRVSKYELLHIFREVFRREDLTVEKARSGKPVNRILASLHPGLNESLWKAAGYPEVPTIRQMVEELSSAVSP